jgi:IS605 OrfB family transposase
MKVKRTLKIRISNKRRNTAKHFTFDLAHFRNLLVIFQNKYYEYFKQVVLNESVIYSLMVDKTTARKSNKQLEALEELSERINQYPELREIIKAMKKQKIRIDNNYTLQTTIRHVIKDYKSFIAALKEYYANPSKFRASPKPPSPRKLDKISHFSTEFNQNSFEITDDTLFLKLRIKGGQNIKIKLPKDAKDITSVRLIYNLFDVWVDIIYEKELEIAENESDYVAAIDIRLNNLISLVSSNPNLKSLIISGREIKSFNHWFNKKNAKLQSEIDKLNNRIAKEDNELVSNDLSNKLSELRFYFGGLHNYRDRWIDSHFHKLTRMLADYLYETGHKKLYIGKGAIESKNGINLGKITNQNFMSVPFRRLIDMLKYKVEEFGIELKEIDEQYTSKASSISDNILEIQEIYIKNRKNKEKTNINFSGRKNSKGLYKDKILNKVFNEGLNSALNILKLGAKLHKLILDLKTVIIKLCNPVKFSVYDFIYKSTSKAEFLLKIGNS